MVFRERDTEGARIADDHQVTLQNDVSTDEQLRLLRTADSGVQCRLVARVTVHAVRHVTDGVNQDGVDVLSTVHVADGVDFLFQVDFFLFEERLDQETTNTFHFRDGIVTLNADRVGTQGFSVVQQAGYRVVGVTDASGADQGFQVTCITVRTSRGRSRDRRAQRDVETEGTVVGVQEQTTGTTVAVGTSSFQVVSNDFGWLQGSNDRSTGASGQADVVAVFVDDRVNGYRRAVNAAVTELSVELAVQVNRQTNSQFTSNDGSQQSWCNASGGQSVLVQDQVRGLEVQVHLTVGAFDRLDEVRTCQTAGVEHQSFAISELDVDLFQADAVVDRVSVIDDTSADQARVLGQTQQVQLLVDGQWSSRHVNVGDATHGRSYQGVVDEHVSVRAVGQNNRNQRSGFVGQDGVVHRSVNQVLTVPVGNFTGVAVLDGVVNQGTTNGDVQTALLRSNDSGRVPHFGEAVLYGSFHVEDDGVRQELGQLTFVEGFQGWSFAGVNNTSSTARTDVNDGSVAVSYSLGAHGDVSVFGWVTSSHGRDGTGLQLSFGQIFIAFTFAVFQGRTQSSESFFDLGAEVFGVAVQFVVGAFVQGFHGDQVGGHLLGSKLSALCVDSRAQGRNNVAQGRTSRAFEFQE
ncbi:hypothetical protein D3C71_364790 [compost metagenome]